MAAPRPLPATPPGLLDDEDPGKWDRVKQALWDTNLNAPIRGVYNLMNADPYTLYTDTGAAGQQAAMDSFDAAGGFTVGSAMIPKPSNALAMGIKAYHGSPHSFDKFSMDKIGTGEGAQAYGHGLYFAEQEDIARSYRDALSPKKVAIGGEMVDSPTFFKAARRSPSVDDNIAMLIKQRENILKEQSQHTDDPELGDFVSELYDQQLKDVDKELAELSQYKGQWFGTRPGGSMYEVNIDADPNAFLDWDKPLSEQPETVKGMLARLPGAPDQSVWPYTTGNDIYEQLRVDAMGDDAFMQPTPQRLAARKAAAPEVSKVLGEAGIPGIKYLDAGSRFTPANLPNNPIANEARQFLSSANGDADKALQMFRDSKPVERWASPERDEITKVIKAAAVPATRNYVVFDDSLIDIIKKYGLAGLLGGGAAANEMMSQPQEQY
jgi:hypothetical protein